MQLHSQGALRLSGGSRPSDCSRSFPVHRRVHACVPRALGAVQQSSLAATLPADGPAGGEEAPKRAQAAGLGGSVAPQPAGIKVSHRRRYLPLACDCVLWLGPLCAASCTSYAGSAAKLGAGVRPLMAAPGQLNRLRFGRTHTLSMGAIACSRARYDINGLAKAVKGCSGNRSKRWPLMRFCSASAQH